MPAPRHSIRRLAVATGVVLVASLVAAGATASSGSVVSSEPTVRAKDGGYTWWTEPLVARTSRSLYFTGVSSKGTQRVYRWSRSGSKRTPTMTYTNLRTRPADDHNAPAISMATGKPSLVFYAGHPGTMFFRRTAGSADPVLKSGHPKNFGPERRMPFDRRVTYAQVLRDGDRVVVLTRYYGGDDSGWYYSTSSNSGRTWTAPTELFDSESHQAYLMVRPHDANRSRLHVLAYYHPKRGPENVVGYREMALADFFSGRAERFTVGAMEPVWTSDEPVVPGAATSSEAGEPAAEPTDVVAPVDPGLLPADEAAPPPEEVPRSSRSVRLLDAGDKRGRTMAFVATWDEKDQVPVYVQMIRRPDGSWSRREIGSAGGGYGAGNGNYIPGLAMDDRRGRNTVYLGYRRGWQWHLASAPIATDGFVGAPRVLRSSARPLARPVPVGRDLMYQRLDRYATYKDYRMTIKTLTLR